MIILPAGTNIKTPRCLMLPLALCLLLSLSLLLSACGDEAAPASQSAPPAPAGRETALAQAGIIQGPKTAPSPTPGAAQVKATPTSGVDSTPLPPAKIPPTYLGITAEPVPSTVPVTVSGATPTPTAKPPALGETAYGVVVFQDAGDIWATTLPENARKQLTSNDGGAYRIYPEGFDRNPVFSPDGQQIAFASLQDIYQQPGYTSGYEVYTMRPDGSNRKRITNSPDSKTIQRIPVAWLKNGQILVRQLVRTSSSPNPITPTGKAPFVLLDPASGKLQDLPVKDLATTALSFSPDGNSIAYSTSKTDLGNTKAELFVMSASGGAPRILTSFSSSSYSAITTLEWSPDGQTISFGKIVGEGCGSFTVQNIARGGGSTRTLYSGDGTIHTMSYAPSGKWLVYSSQPCSGTSALHLLDSQQGGTPVDLGDGRYPGYGRKITA
ncbi:MAG TPA: hypothetical protein VH186_04160 [Chloroflexia bacterium]|nr:hypothetical protein [Chloroflexia bacterium]